MKISSLRTILESYNDNDEIAVSIAVNDSKIPVITYDVSFGASEHEELMLKVSIYSSDLDE